jgi:hypothetical protein
MRLGVVAHQARCTQRRSTPSSTHAHQECNSVLTVSTCLDGVFNWCRKCMHDVLLHGDGALRNMLVQEAAVISID